MNTATENRVKATAKSLTIAGIPNCGKTTFFNSLTGARQRVGNWAGVTVERVEGTLHLTNESVNLVDLPGTYNLNPDTEDQRIAAHSIESREHDLIINVVDASNLSRNLFLTQDILKRSQKVIVLLNMIDVAEQEGMVIDPEALSKELGVPVCPVIGVNKKSVDYAKQFIEEALEGKHSNGKIPDFPATTEDAYEFIDKICSRVTKERETKGASLTDKIDSIVLNRWLGGPIFLLSMFVVFWFAVSMGGVFIDFFDKIAGLIFVDSVAYTLKAIGSPDWLIALLSGGLGAGIQTVATFIPVVFFIFLALAILQDLGYMARLAVLADKFMRFIGLPGNAFIPMMVGFGCTVPAVMSARTLSTKRDRYLTIFMAPFMSCGARLPVYALFCAALFGKNSALVVFAIYLLGIVMATLTGLMLKGTLFKGQPSRFVTDMPFYHRPRPLAILKTSFTQLKSFVVRAGAIITVAVLILGFFNSMGYGKDEGFSFGNENTEKSILSSAGKMISPIFVPIGIKEENWPASVALFTGLFAKETIVGTVNSLYSGMGYEAEAAQEKSEDKRTASDESVTDESQEEKGVDVIGTLREAVESVKDNFIDLFTTADVMGVGIVTEDQDAIAKEIEADTATFYHIKKNFTPVSAFAYLLFVLLYFPCLAVVGAAKKEMGSFYTLLFVTYLTLLGWSVATLFYQVAEGHNPYYIGISLAILGAIYGMFTRISKSRFAFKE